MSKTTIPIRVKRRLAHEARHRCGYCRCSEFHTGVPLEVDHLVPEAAGGSSKESNLWLACIICNKHKGAQTHARDFISNRRVRLFNPRKQAWKDHFEWSKDGVEIIGKTPSGRATVEALQLNRPLALHARRNWIAADPHPPKE